MLGVASLSKGSNFLLFYELVSRKTFSKSVKNGNGWFIEFIILVLSYWLSMIKVKTSSIFWPKYHSWFMSEKLWGPRKKSGGFRNLRCLRSVWYCCCCWYCFCRDACGVRPKALFGSGFKRNTLESGPKWTVKKLRNVWYLDSLGQFGRHWVNLFNSPNSPFGELYILSLNILWKNIFSRLL